MDTMGYVLSTFWNLNCHISIKSGKVFITNDRLCFYSNVLGVEVSFTAKWIQIASLLATAFGKGQKVGSFSTTSAKWAMKKNDSLIYIISMYMDAYLYIYICLFIFTV